MSNREEKQPWPSVAARYLNHAESAVLILVGVVLVIIALLLLGYSVFEIYKSVRAGTIPHEAIDILNSVLLVMMTMEIVYTVAISLQSHTLVAEPFLIIGAIAGIRRMLVITAKQSEGDLALFRVTLWELALLAATVIAMAIAVYILRKGSTLEAAKPSGHGEHAAPDPHPAKPADHQH